MVSRCLSVLIALSVVAGAGCSSSKTTPPAVVTDKDSDTVLDAADNCPGVANPDQLDMDKDGEGDACDMGYTFLDASGDSTVSYTGQTARHLIIADLLTNIKGLSRNDEARTKEQVVEQELNKYYLNILEEGQVSGTALDTVSISYTLGGSGVLVTNTTDAADTTLGSVSTTKNLKGKISGNDKCNHLLNDGTNTIACGDAAADTWRGEFFGWEDGLNVNPLVRTPDELVTVLFDWLAEESTKDTITHISGTTVDVGPVYLDGMGRDLSQLIQKFLLGAVTFSQGTADYLQADFGSESALALKEGKNHTAGQHSFDEAFGYYGAAQNAPIYTDIEARGGKSVDDGARAGFEFGYNDINGDSLINIRSEVMLGNSTNCAKRDLGTAGNGADATNYTADAFNAFASGRYILQMAGDAGTLTAEQKTELDAHIKIASQTWEKCIAATVVHYINELDGDLSNFAWDESVDFDNYSDVAKHWSEMKGFALGLQFSPSSPFRLGENGANIDGLKTVLSNMGDAPVLANGTQLGNDYPWGDTAKTRVGMYRAKLMEARDILQDAYGFADANVTGW